MPIVTKKNNPRAPHRIMIYGPEGSGKTTFGALSERPIFIAAEGGTDRINPPVDELPGMNHWDSIMSGVKSLITEEHDFKTLVLDSADWIEKLCHARIIGQSGKSIVTTSGGYGAGYRESERLHRELIESLSQLREKKQMNIVVTAHAHVRAVRDPSLTEDYDSFEIKCHEMVSSLWREWVDALFFVRLRTLLRASTGNDKARAFSDGKRVVYTTKTPSFQAKNRYGLPSEMEFDLSFWKTFNEKTSGGEISTQALLEEISSLRAQIKDEALSKKIADTVKAASPSELPTILNRLQQIVKGANT